jgi:hypothetical protein
MRQEQFVARYQANGRRSSIGWKVVARMRARRLPNAISACWATKTFPRATGACASNCALARRRGYSPAVDHALAGADAARPQPAVPHAGAALAARGANSCWPISRGWCAAKPVACGPPPRCSPCRWSPCSCCCSGPAGTDPRVDGPDAGRQIERMYDPANERHASWAATAAATGRCSATTS